MSYQAVKTHGGNLNALLSERSQSEKPTYCMIPIIRHFKEGKTMETVKKTKQRLLKVKGKGEMNRQSTGDFQGS